MTSRWAPIGFLAAVFGCGLIDAAWWAVLAGAWGLTALRFDAQGVLVDKHAPAIGRIEAWGLFIGASFAGNAAACAAAFAAGKALIKNDKRVTNDPMEAHVIGFAMWVEAVKKAGSTDADKVIDAIVGIKVPNLTGGISEMPPNRCATNVCRAVLRSAPRGTMRVL